jgi:hypothetical protein
VGENRKFEIGNRKEEAGGSWDSVPGRNGMTNHFIGGLVSVGLWMGCGVVCLSAQPDSAGVGWGGVSVGLWARCGVGVGRCNRPLHPTRRGLGGEPEVLPEDGQHDKLLGRLRTAPLTKRHSSTPGFAFSNFILSNRCAQSFALAFRHICSYIGSDGLRPTAAPFAP